MKKSRLAALLMIIILSLGSQGCGKIWYVDFTEPGSLDGWKQLDWSGGPHTATVDTNGLYLDGKIVTAPIGFDGDFEMQLKFDMVTSDTSYVFYAFLAVTDGGDPSFEEYIKAELFFLGSKENERYYIGEGNPSIDITEGYEIPGLVRDGPNVFKISRKGTTLKMFMNRSPLCNVDLSSYSAAWSFPVLYIDKMAGSGSIYFTSIKVVYNGNVTNLP